MGGRWAVAALWCASWARWGWADLEPGNDVFPGDPIGLGTHAGSLEDRGNADAISTCGHGPDTVLGALDAGGVLIALDDDGSPVGDGTASAVFAVPLDGPSARVRVSGFDDFDFDGMRDGSGAPHGQSGLVEVVVRFWAGGVVVGEVTREVMLTASGVIALDEPAPGAAEAYDAIIDNTPSSLARPAADRDFYVVMGLTPMEDYVVELTSGPFDGVLGVFDSAGALVGFDDDDGAGLLPLVVGRADGLGRMWVAVSGFNDADFDGYGESVDLPLCPHPQVGVYELRVMLACAADLTGDLLVNTNDFFQFLAWFQALDGRADLTGDGLVNTNDFFEFLARYADGCPK